MVWLFLFVVLLVVSFLFFREPPVARDSYEIVQSREFKESLFFENNPYVIETPDSEAILRTVRSCFWTKSNSASWTEATIVHRSRWLLLQSSEKRVIRLVPPSQQGDFTVLGANARHAFYDLVEPRADAMDNGAQSKVLAIVLHPGMMVVVPRDWFVVWEAGVPVQATFYDGVSWEDVKTRLKRGVSLVRPLIS